MPDITGMTTSQDSGSSQTTMKITSYTLTPSTTSKATLVTFNIRLTMSEWTWVGTHSSDSSYGRRVRGTINGHDIGVHLVKPHASVYWYKSGVYNYTITKTIPYSPGTVYANIRVERENGTTGGTACFNPALNYWTMGSGYASAPSVTRDTKIAGSTGTTLVASLTGTKALTWTAPSSSGTGAIQNYHVYYTYGSGWVRKAILNSSARSYTINLAEYSVSRGNYIWFRVYAVNLYAESATQYVPATLLVTLPVAPSSLTVASTVNYNQSVTVSWPAGSAQAGVKHYSLQVRRYPRGGPWSSWASLGTHTGRSVSTNPSAYSAWAVRPGDTFQFQVTTVDNLGLTSSARASGNLLLKGGVMRVKVNGTWRDGIAWIRVGGVWKEGIAAYRNVNGSWKEGI